MMPMRATFCALWIAIALVVQLPADDSSEPPWLSLLRPNSLAGWEHGEPVEGWAVEDGLLQGSGRSSELLGGWTFGDFELQLDWKAGDDAAVLLKLAGVDGDSQVGFKLMDKAVDVESRKGVIEGRPVEAPERDAFHSIHIRREGKRLTYKSPLGIGGLEVPEEARFALRLAAARGEVAIRNIRVREPRGEAVFNEKDLTGWWCPGNKNAWQVEDGVLVKRGRGGNYLRTEKEYGNFTLSLEYKMETARNSGIGIRTPRNGWPSGDGMELQLLTSPGVNKSANMALYRNYAPLARADDPQEWNHNVVKADGYMISAWVNGKLVQHANTYRHPELKHRYLKGWIGFQDHGGVVKFRDIHVLAAPAGTGPREWTEPDQPRGAELVLDRIMNQQRLSDADDRIASHFLHRKLEGGKKDSEETIAELEGPGAIVRFIHQGADGELWFHFDGEASPRIRTSAKGLKGRVPKLTDHAQPLLTYVAFEKSLKIVRRGEKPGEYWIDWVSLPASADVQTYSGPDESILRGWLPAIDYRHAHYRFGQYRQHDPLPEQDSQQHKIEPGSAARLISLEGAGVVHWTRLRCPKGMLQADDLWLEVQVDGEKQPALACPARYFYAAIHDAKNYHNLLMTHRGGFFSRMAMPYGNGLTITARNRGEKPLSGVGMTVSYQLAEQSDKDIAGRMRLRGKFGSGANAALVGGGRLVGVVWDASTGGEKLGDVSADGQRIGALSDVSVATFLGGSESPLRRCLSGRDDKLAWRFLLLAPIEFREGLQLELEGAKNSELLLLYYQRP